jgi:nicotinamidase-related amidase
MSATASTLSPAVSVDLAADAALIVIDLQKGFDDSSFWGPRNNPGAEGNVERLVDEWTRSGRPLIFVRHDSSGAASPLRAGGEGNAFKPAIAGREPDLLVTKSVNSAFYGEPDLHAWLQSAGVSQLVICGIQTNMCNETTARMAGNLGYDVLFVLDAMHTFDLEGPFGVMTADELTRATATTLQGGGFARVVGTDDVLGTGAGTEHGALSTEH